MRSPTRTFAATVLSFEALVVFFAGLVAMNLSDLDRTTGLVVFSVLALACLVVAGMLRSPAGYAVGWVLQAAIVASGVLVPMMFGVGAIFAFLWWNGLRLGRRIERERAAVADGLVASSGQAQDGGPGRL